MRVIALFGDIHSNIQALEACLEDAEAHGVTRYVFLGDFVGYGGDPGKVLAKIEAMVVDGAVAVKGNHDDMASDFDREMNETAASAANWTRNQLSKDQQKFLDSLPMMIEDEDRLYVHADASAPTKWRYVTDCASAQLSLEGTQSRIVVCGHVHQPANMVDKAHQAGYPDHPPARPSGLGGRGGRANQGQILPMGSHSRRQSPNNGLPVAI